MCVILYSYYDTDDIYVCYVDCDGDEDRLQDCSYIRTFSCACSGDVIGITCSK